MARVATTDERSTSLVGLSAIALLGVLWATYCGPGKVLDEPTSSSRDDSISDDAPEQALQALATPGPRTQFDPAEHETNDYVPVGDGQDSSDLGPWTIIALTTEGVPFQGPIEALVPLPPAENFSNHPGDSAINGTWHRGMSPLEIPRTGAQVDEIFVRASGTAWGMVSPTHGGSVFEIRLGPGGDYLVRISGSIPPNAILRILTVGTEDLIAEFALGPDRRQLLIESLPVGALLGIVRVGGSWRSDDRVVEHTLDVQSGALRETTIMIPEMAEESGGAISGTIVLPSQWSIRQPDIRGVLLEAAYTPSSLRSSFSVLLSPSETGIHSFHVDELRPGTYSVSVRDGGGWRDVRYSEMVNIVSGQASKVEIAVPPPAWVSLSVLDPSGAPSTEDVGIDLRVLNEAGDEMAYEGYVVPGGTSKEIEGPEGPISINSNSILYAGHAAKHMLEGEGGAIEYQLKSACGVRFVPDTEGLDLSYLGWAFSVTSMSGEDAYLRSGGLGEEDVYVQVSSPGRYRISSEPVDGLELEHVDTVVVREGEFTDVAVKARQ